MRVSRHGQRTLIFTFIPFPSLLPLPLISHFFFHWAWEFFSNLTAGADRVAFCILLIWSRVQHAEEFSLLDNIIHYLGGLMIYLARILYSHTCSLSFSPLSPQRCT
ncbi:hypothetical protein V8C42DRAFT_190145 [Trichoderma barbatum]